MLSTREREAEEKHQQQYQQQRRHEAEIRSLVISRACMYPRLNEPSTTQAFHKKDDNDNDNDREMQGVVMQLAIIVNSSSR